MAASAIECASFARGPNSLPARLRRPAARARAARRCKRGSLRGVLWSHDAASRAGFRRATGRAGCDAPCAPAKAPRGAALRRVGRIASAPYPGHPGRAAHVRVAAARSAWRRRVGRLRARTARCAEATSAPARCGASAPEPVDAERTAGARRVAAVVGLDDTAVRRGISAPSTRPRAGALPCGSRASRPCPPPPRRGRRA